MNKNLLLFLPAIFGLVFLSGCGAPVGLAAWSGGAMYATKPGDLPPADTDNQMPAHESWCYSTMGMQVECFSEPQATPPGRLVNVDPANKYPLNRKAYDEALLKAQTPPKPSEMAKPDDVQNGGANDIIRQPDIPPSAQNNTLHIVPPPVESAPLSLAPKAPQAHKHAVKHHKKKVKKKAASPTTSTTPSSTQTPASTPVDTAVPNPSK